MRARVAGAGDRGGPGSAAGLRPGGAACVPAAAEHAQQEQHDHRSDDRADDAAQIELVRVADPEHPGEKEVADERADDADGDRRDEAHRVVARKQRTTEVPGNDADDDGGDDLSDHGGGPFRGWGPAGVTPDRPPSCVRMRTAPKWEVKRPTSKVSMSSDDPVILTCAISGAVANRDQCPAIPYTPEEYAAEARRIVDEGGVMIHIHARRPDGTPSHEVEDFRAITDAIPAEAGAAAIVNYSTGAIGVPLGQRVAYLRELRPEVAALNMGSMNYAKYSRSRKGFV